jgi:glycosyltransferase involved in cell wall biosynthesis
MASVNLVARDNKFGLSSDLRLLADAIEASGHSVYFSTMGRGKMRKWSRPPRMHARRLWWRLLGREPYDVNIMLEHVRPEDLSFARVNLLVPNPEWCDRRDMSRLARIDGVLLKTAHARAIFGGLAHRTEYVGFTSDDRLDRSVRREQAFFHLAGRSANKGTETLLATWRRHPEWPRLTVLQNPRSAQPGQPAPNIDHRIDYIPDDELKRLQNAHRFHLCPSETEGFGHYLVEAMSVGAVVVTLDAPPMNEMVTPARGALIPYVRTGTQGLATTYFYDQAALEGVIERLLATPESMLDRMGAAARAWFEENDLAFRRRIGEAIAASVASRTS